MKTLEEKGIGRPSTYASIINTIQERDYVKKLQQKLVPTEIGMVVTELLVKNFPYIFETGYTAKLEGELDAVEDGTEKWTDLLDGFYGHLEAELKGASVKNMEEIKAWEKPTDEICEKCGAKLILKWGKFGSFYSCSNFTKQKPITVALGPLQKRPQGDHQEGYVDAFQLSDAREGDDRGYDRLRRVPKVNDKSQALLKTLQDSRRQGEEADRRARQLRLHEGKFLRQA